MLVHQRVTHPTLAKLLLPSSDPPTRDHHRWDWLRAIHPSTAQWFPEALRHGRSMVANLNMVLQITHMKLNWLENWIQNKNDQSFRSGTPNWTIPMLAVFSKEMNDFWTYSIWEISSQPRCTTSQSKQNERFTCNANVSHTMLHVFPSLHLSFAA